MDQTESDLNAIFPYAEIKLEMKKLGFSQFISDQQLRSTSVEAVRDTCLRGYIVQLRTRLLAKSVEHHHWSLDTYINKMVELPADWWQAFKLRWFPKRLLQIWPVKYEYHPIIYIVHHHDTYTRICPHLDIPTTHEKEITHLRWLEEDDD